MNALHVYKWSHSIGEFSKLQYEMEHLGTNNKIVKDLEQHITTNAASDDNYIDYNFICI